MNTLPAELSKIPPVTRFLAGSSLVVTLPVLLRFVSVRQIVYHWTLVFWKFQLWRIWTTFFYSGAPLQFLFDFIMLYRTSNALETEHYASRSADYTWQLLLVALSLFVCAYHSTSFSTVPKQLTEGFNHPLVTHILQRPFLLSLVYLSSRLSPNTLFSLFGLITIEAKYWPYVLLILDGVQGGQLALVQSLTGLLAGHIWFLLAWRDEEARRSSIARAPAWLVRLIPNRRVVTPGSTGPQPPGFQARQQNNTRITGHNWGTGHRLGDS